MEQEFRRGLADILNCDFLSSSTMFLSTLFLDCSGRALSTIFLNFELLVYDYEVQILQNGDVLVSDTDTSRILSDTYPRSI